MKFYATAYNYHGLKRSDVRRESVVGIGSGSGFLPESG